MSGASGSFVRAHRGPFWKERESWKRCQRYAELLSSGVQSPARLWNQRTWTQDKNKPEFKTRFLFHHLISPLSPWGTWTPQQAAASFVTLTQQFLPIIFWREVNIRVCLSGVIFGYPKQHIQAPCAWQLRQSYCDRLAQWQLLPAWVSLGGCPSHWEPNSGPGFRNLNTSWWCKLAVPTSSLAKSQLT